MIYKIGSFEYMVKDKKLFFRHIGKKPGEWKEIGYNWKFTVKKRKLTIKAEGVEYSSE